MTCSFWIPGVTVPVAYDAIKNTVHELSLKYLDFSHSLEGRDIDNLSREIKPDALHDLQLMQWSVNIHSRINSFYRLIMMHGISAWLIFSS